MSWKEHLSKNEQSKDWKSATALMQETISKNDSGVDAYLSINYLLMNLIVEEEYDHNDHEYYAGLLKKYFTESYAKFSNNPEYLFFIGQIASMSEWYYDIEIEEAQSMIKKALALAPDNLLYKWANYIGSDMREPSNVERMTLYAKQAQFDFGVVKELKSKGALGKYLWELLGYWNNEKIIK